MLSTVKFQGHVEQKNAKYKKLHTICHEILQHANYYMFTKSHIVKA